MLSPKLQEEVQKVAKGQAHQYSLWKEWEEGKTLFQTTIAKICIASSEIDPNQNIDALVRWLIINKNNTSTGSNSMKNAFLDVDNCWTYFNEYEGAEIADELYEYLEVNLELYYSLV